MLIYAISAKAIAFLFYNYAVLKKHLDKFIEIVIGIVWNKLILYIKPIWREINVY